MKKSFFTLLCCTAFIPLVSYAQSAAPISTEVNQVADPVQETDTLPPLRIKEDQIATAQPAASKPLYPAEKFDAAPVLPVKAAPADYNDMYFTSNITLTKQEKAAIAIAEKWNGGAGPETTPVPGADGSVNFMLRPGVSIVCAPLQICDVELEQGEIINQFDIGDPRWEVKPSLSGKGDSSVTHLILKPADSGLDTTLIVTTDRRTYNLRLRSHAKKFMPRVTFTYSDTQARKMQEYQVQAQAAKEEATIPTTQEYLGDLNFAYDISGDAKWKPVRVYNDGKKTFIDMPTDAGTTELPVLFVVRGKNSILPWGSKAEEVMVNTRYQNGRFMVDYVFDKAILVSGVGKNQQKITIERAGA